MGRARAVACPSLIDAAPGILFEASAMGCNVVASRNCGNWEICHPDLLADPCTSDAFAACLTRARATKHADHLDRFLERRSYRELVKILTALSQPLSRGDVMSPRPEISAVVLSVGEPYAQRALDSLAAQTIPLRKVVLVENVSPFSRALNEGVRQVETPFFVQVNADMILDPRCVETLLDFAEDDAGIVVAELRDALAGTTVGVKLFRTACFQREGMRDSLAQDTDFVRRLERQGWRTVYVTSADGERPTLGEHRPDYTAAYAFRKHVVEGARLRHRAARHGLFWRMGVLEVSSHPMALLAQLALGHGFFFRSDRDELRPSAEDPRARWLAALLAGEGQCDDPPLLPLDRYARLRDVFDRFLAAGQSLGRANAGATVRQVFGGLAGARRNWRALVAKVALGHGLLMNDEDRRRLEQDRQAFGRFMVFSLGSRSTAWDAMRARVQHVVTSRRRPPSIPPW